MLPSRYAEEAADFYHFQPRHDDLWVVTFPRSGTTLTQELTWLLANDCDFTTARKIPLVERFPFLEGSIQSDRRLMKEVLQMVRGNPVLEAIAERYEKSRVPDLIKTSSTRFIKTHLPFSLLPATLLRTAKVIYVARNPKDVVVSYYHHNRLLRALGYVGDFQKYYNYLERDLLAWCPYWEHVREAWQLRDHPNLLFLFYEDLVKNMSKTIQRIADFLGKSINEAQVSKIHGLDGTGNNIENFRLNPSTNLDSEALPGLRVEGEQNFIRKGEIDSWREEGFTSELTARADKWVQENLASIPGLSFPEY
ncbi:hypothetical protein B566_EDAN004621 [Ephemera danica]|nr:hypothetical protein B566_EDAN004621 [Ephemera danica]